MLPRAGSNAKRLKEQMWLDIEPRASSIWCQACGREEAALFAHPRADQSPKCRCKMLRWSEEDVRPSLQGIQVVARTLWLVEALPDGEGQILRCCHI